MGEDAAKPGHPTKIAHGRPRVDKYPMRLLEFSEPVLTEKRVGVVYHFTTMSNAWTILWDHVLKPKGEGGIEAHDGMFVIDRGRDWVSLTRNKNLTVTPNTGAVSRSGEPWGEVRLALNGDKLAHRHKIKPYHDDDGTLTRQDNQAEEKITGEVDIKGAVLGILFHYDLYMRNQTRYDTWSSMPDEEQQARYTQMAREDAAHFIKWCRERGYPIEVRHGLPRSTK